MFTWGQINNWPCAGMYRWVCGWITDGDYSLQGLENPGEEGAERSEEQEEGGDGYGMLTYHLSWLLYPKGTPVVACTGPTQAWACGDPSDTFLTNKQTRSLLQNDKIYFMIICLLSFQE